MKPRDCAASAGRRSQALPEPAESRILVAGIVRDCASHIESEIKRLAAALAAFRSVSWLMIESDSGDDTLARLRALERTRDCFSVISLGRLGDRIPKRSQRLAACRNTYLQELRCNPGYEDVDFVMVADLDGVNSMITQSAVASCWQRQDWDVCTANQSGPYYDLWALRHPEWSPNDCWAQYRFLLRHAVSSERARAVAVHARMIRLDREAEWIEVQSAFGGLAIYRRHAVQSGQYSGVDAEGLDTCEHVPFHAELRAHGSRIFINPGLINTDYTEHSAALFMRNRMARVAKNALRRVVRRGR